MMKILMLFVLSFFIAQAAEAGQIIERHNFYKLYDPTSDSFVYSKAGATATGDQVAVNTYTRKSIQITGVNVGEYIVVNIEGRSKSQLDTRTGSGANWAVLDSVEFGAASADTAINQIVDVTEYVDFLRVGIRKSGTDGTSRIDIEGIFTNLER